jgi:hypothetical protein
MELRMQPIAQLNTLMQHAT